MNLHSFAVASKKRVSVSCCLETILTSTSHGSISETLDDILSGQTEFDSGCRIQSDHSKCHQVSLKWSHDMLKSGLFPNSKTQIHASCLRRQTLHTIPAQLTSACNNSLSEKRYHFSRRLNA